MHRLLIIVSLAYMGCASEQEQASPLSAEAIRMKAIVLIAIDKAADPSHRELLKNGGVFVDLQDLDVPCVGVAVPLPETENRAFLSFTKEWFHAHTNDEVATALLEDLDKALSESN